jgi:hypothetical protein
MSILPGYTAGVVSELYQGRIMRPNDAKAQIPTNLGFAPSATVAGKSMHRLGLIDS